MMELPPELALQLSQFVTTLEEEQKMEYVSSIERIKLEQNIILVEQTMLCRLLTRRFGELPQWVNEKVKIASKPEVEFWFDRGVDAETLVDVFQDLAH
jgi:hypothetical protein